MSENKAKKRPKAKVKPKSKGSKTLKRDDIEWMSDQIDRIAVAELKPGDAIVVFCERALSPAQHEHITMVIGHKILKDKHKVLIVDNGFDFGILRQG